MIFYSGSIKNYTFDAKNEQIKFSHENHSSLIAKGILFIVPSYIYTDKIKLLCWSPDFTILASYWENGNLAVWTTYGNLITHMSTCSILSTDNNLLNNNNFKKNNNLPNNNNLSNNNHFLKNNNLSTDESSLKSNTPRKPNLNYPQITTMVESLNDSKISRTGEWKVIS